MVVRIDSIVNQTTKEATEFIQKIDPREKVLIVYGHDNDSITSAVLVYRILKRFKRMEAEFFSTGDNFAVSDQDVAEIEQINPDVIIIVDIAHLSSKEVADKLASYKTLIIDHHQPLKLEGITYCNPRMHEPGIYMPVSYIVYRMYERAGESSDVAWIAGIGVLSDHAVSMAVDLFDKIKNTNPALIGKTRLREEDLFDSSTLGQLAKMFDSARIVDGRNGALVAARTLADANSYQIVMRGATEGARKLIKWSEDVDKEFKRIVSDFNLRRELVKPNVIFYEIQSKYSIKSSVAGYLTQFYKDKILLISQTKGDSLDISFRRGDMVKTDLNRLVKKAIDGIPESTGGGHEAASAARIPKRFLPKLIKQL